MHSIMKMGIMKEEAVFWRPMLLDTFKAGVQGERLDRAPGVSRSPSTREEKAESCSYCHLHLLSPWYWYPTGRITADYVPNVIV